VQNKGEINVKKFIAILTAILLLLGCIGFKIFTENEELKVKVKEKTDIIKTKDNEIKSEIAIKDKLANRNSELASRNEGLNKDLSVLSDIDKFKQKLKIAETFKITAYDLSFASCEKYPNDLGYGMTFGGYNLRGKNWKSARMVAADMNVLGLGTLIYIQFINSYEKYSGVYMVGDKGGGVIGNHIDLFIGGQSPEEMAEVDRFGVTYAKVIKIN
jgi:3D (Asp-Asp-Asp) domain-containing protein